MSETFTEEFTDELEQPGHHQDHDEPELVYPHAEAWVVGWLLPHYRRNPRTHRWDPQWWRYEEVATLLESLWETWEQLRLEGATGNLVFFRDYLWPIMDVITSDEGPLWNYNATRQREVPPTWEHEPAPEGYFTAEDSLGAQ